MTDAMWYFVMVDDLRRITKVTCYHRTPKGLLGLTADEWDVDGVGTEVAPDGMRFCFFRSYSLDLLKTTHASWFYPNLTIEDAA